jgi:hypothetical protein
MPSLDSVRFDTTNWKLVSRERSLALWGNEHGDMFAVSYLDGPPGVPAAGDPGPALRDSFSQLAGDALELLAVERRAVAGASAVVSLMRTRKGTGWRYGAAVMLPFAEFTYSFFFMADEHGTTGVREAMAHYWAATTTGDFRTPLTPEQEQILDAVLPAHPQARVRTYLDELLGSLTLGTDLHKANTWPPTRLPTTTGSLEVKDGAVLRRATGGRLVGRFPLAEIRDVRLIIGWWRAAIAVSVVAAAGAILAVTQLSGWWAIGGGVLGGLVALFGVASWRSCVVALDTMAGTLQWRTFEEAFLATGSWRIPSPRGRRKSQSRATPVACNRCSRRSPPPGPRRASRRGPARRAATGSA